MKANVAANVDAYGKGGVDLSLDTEKIQAEAASRIAKFQSAAEKEKERALALNAADTAEKQKRAAEVAAQAAANLAETTEGVKASIASDKALQVLKEDAAKGSERYNAALAKAQQADLDAIQAQTKAALSEQFAAVSDATAEAASKTAAGVAKQVETAKKSDFLAKSASSVQASLPVVEVVAPDIGGKVADFQAKGQAELAKAQEASAQDAAKMGKAFETAKAKAAAGAARAAAENAEAAAAVLAQTAVALQQVEVPDVGAAVEAKKAEVNMDFEP